MIDSFKVLLFRLSFLSLHPSAFYYGSTIFTAKLFSLFFSFIALRGKSRGIFSSTRSNKGPPVRFSLLVHLFLPASDEFLRVWSRNSLKIFDDQWCFNFPRWISAITSSQSSSARAFLPLKRRTNSLNHRSTYRSIRPQIDSPKFTNEVFIKIKSLSFSLYTWLIVYSYMVKKTDSCRSSFQKDIYFSIWWIMVSITNDTVSRIFPSIIWWSASLSCWFAVMIARNAACSLWLAFVMVSTCWTHCWLFAAIINVKK